MENVKQEGTFKIPAKKKPEVFETEAQQKAARMEPLISTKQEIPKVVISDNPEVEEVKEEVLEEEVVTMTEIVKEETPAVEEVVEETPAIEETTEVKEETKDEADNSENKEEKGE